MKVFMSTMRAFARVVMFGAFLILLYSITSMSGSWRSVNPPETSADQEVVNKLDRIEKTLNKMGE